MLEAVALLLAALRSLLRSHRDLAVENVLLRHQLAVLTRPARKRPRLRSGDKALWLLARRYCAEWRRHLIVVRPETVIRWHRQGWRLFWRWRSHAPLGRPRLSADTQEPIRRVSRDNPLRESAEASIRSV